MSEYIKKEWFCACNKAPCDGICKKKNLHRKRDTLDICPAACEKRDLYKHKY